MNLNPFSAPIAALATKIFAGAFAFAAVGCSVQTVRIEGALCRSVKVGEKPACIVQGFKQDLAVIRIDLEAVRADRQRERDNHAATKAAYRAAQAEAEQLEKARLARVTAEQKEKNDALSQDFQRRVADARAVAERLRQQAAAGGGGASGAGAGVAVRALPVAAGGAAGATGPLSADERLTAEIQTITLEALQRFVREQHGVNPN